MLMLDNYLNLRIITEEQTHGLRNHHTFHVVKFTVLFNIDLLKTSIPLQLKYVFKVRELDLLLTDICANPCYPRLRLISGNAVQEFTINDSRKRDSVQMQGFEHCYANKRYRGFTLQVPLNIFLRRNTGDLLILYLHF